MHDNQPKKPQFELDFEHRVVVDDCGQFQVEIQSDAASTPDVEQSATVFSITDRIAQKTQAQDDALYEGILSRIKHLDFS